ncbi:MAG: 3-dehydroquinate synthase [Treponema sp.]|jgi:3-dehydroquinate synthase|nr:3-dehydroquinate synthase [Treponema sp.]
MRKVDTFRFGTTVSQVCIQSEVPALDELFTGDQVSPGGVLLVCDTNTASLARNIRGDLPICTLPPGETSKGWASIEVILQAAKAAGLGRDGFFIGIGGGVVTDMTAFAASVYMRGARLCLVSTTLLGMVDAALGGKTGFDLFDMKNLVGTFYPASRIFMPIEALKTLPRSEWKSGMAELIKTAVLDIDDQDGEFWSLLSALQRVFIEEQFPQNLGELDRIVACISRSVRVKGRIVEADPHETGEVRMLLNLGHTFAHALESVAVLGRLSHGEAVAWGIVRACELGCALGITPEDRAAAISGLLRAFGYETAAPHPMMQDRETFMRALGGDKKKKGGTLMFVVPGPKGAQLVSAALIGQTLLTRIIDGGYTHEHQ